MVGRLWSARVQRGNLIFSGEKIGNKEAAQLLVQLMLNLCLSLSPFASRHRSCVVFISVCMLRSLISFSISELKLRRNIGQVSRPTFDSTHLANQTLPQASAMTRQEEEEWIGHNGDTFTVSLISTRAYLLFPEFPLRYSQSPVGPFEFLEFSITERWESCFNDLLLEHNRLVNLRLQVSRYLMRIRGSAMNKRPMFTDAAWAYHEFQALPYEQGQSRLSGTNFLDSSWDRLKSLKNNYLNCSEDYEWRDRVQ